MYKKLLCGSAMLLIAISLAGCKSRDYENAVKAIKNKEYETAFELLEDLGDYRDCRQLLTNNIKEYASSLAKKDYYGKALNLLKTYHSVSDFGDLYDDIDQQKELHTTYQNAESCFSVNAIEGGFSLLDTLPSDYRNIQKIYDTYNQLKDTRFIGEHREGAVGEVSQAIVFEIYYSSNEHVFQLHVNKQIYWSDGTVYKEHDFYIDPDDIENGNTINYDGYTWMISDNGKLTEIDKGETYSYN